MAADLMKFQDELEKSGCYKFITKPLEPRIDVYEETEAKIWVDPIVEEIHRFREERAQKFNYDIKAMFDDLMQLQDELKKKVTNS
jgi:hypothetical protein